jgi:hypothetical protein
MGTKLTQDPPGRGNVAASVIPARAAPSPLSPAAPRPAPARTPQQAPAQASPAEFRIRFTQQPQLPTLLRRPTNSFRWAGPGSLRFEPLGIAILARRRQVCGFYRTERLFVAAPEIRDVYREGNAIRVDLRSASGPSPFFRFWAETPAAAAIIVDLLPTAHTIEFENGPSSYAAYSSVAPSSWRAAWLCLLAVAVLATLVWFATRWDRRTAAVQSTPTVTMLGSATPFAHHPVQPSTAETRAARAQLQRFSERADALATQFALASTTLQTGGMSQESFAAGLDNWLTPQWQVLQLELESHSPLPDSAAAAVFEPLFAATVSWQQALKVYSSGLRNHDPAEVLRSFGYIRDAEDYQRHAKSRQ